MTASENTGASAPSSPPADKDVLAGRAMTNMRREIWEASQFMETSEISGYVRAVLAEIDADAD